MRAMDAGRTFIATDLSSRLRNFNANQTGRRRADHEPLSPTVVLIKELFVAPDHFPSRAVRFFPNELLVDVPFPFRRIARHVIYFEEVRHGAGPMGIGGGRGASKIGSTTVR